jgi:hypothetical protein
MTQNTSHAVMAQRKEPDDSLDFFPTPPWATRALCEWLITAGCTDLQHELAWEPACGEGHMVRPLKEYLGLVCASDVHDYGRGQNAIVDFLFPNPEMRADWIITNPPFRLAEQFATTALKRARMGAALLVRTVFLESGERWRTLYNVTPPTDVLIFCERVPMLKGRLERTASSATSYAWFVWRHPIGAGTRLRWLPPGTRKRLERASDYDEVRP